MSVFQSSLIPTVHARFEQDTHVAVWRLPTDISQSRLAGRNSPSNACTLIALQLVEFIERRNLHFASPTVARRPLASLSGHGVRAVAGATTTVPPPQVTTAAPTAQPSLVICPRYMVATFIEAMIDGNEAHEQATRTRPASEQNFTIPDAITALDSRFDEIDFCTVSGSFIQQLPKFIRIALRSPSLSSLARVYFAIIAFERTVLLVADRPTSAFLLLDSHLHGTLDGKTVGAIVATAHMTDLLPLTHWMSEHIFPETFSAHCVQEFEISTIVYKGALDTVDCFDTSPKLARRTPRPVMRPTPIFIDYGNGENKKPANNVPLTRQISIMKRSLKRSADSDVVSVSSVKVACSDGKASSMRHIVNQ